MSDIKRIDINEFREFGYLQELNRLFLHPLGMALEVTLDDTGKVVALGGIWDYRDEIEGMGYADGEIEIEKILRVQEAWFKKQQTRIKILGYVVQPVDSNSEA